MSAAFDIALGMLRQVAQDAENDGDVKEWITLSGQAVPVKEGQTHEEAGKAFTEKQEQPKSQQDDVFGEAFTAYKGKPAEAIEHLLKEKRGHVPGAFHKEGLGDIDLPWGKTGKKGFGLAHIIERRNAQGMDSEAFVRDLPRLIKEGRIERRPDYPGRAYIVHPNGEAAIRLDWNREQRNWIVTAYPLNNAPGAKDGLRTCVPAYDAKQSFPLAYSGWLSGAEYNKSHKKATSNAATALDHTRLPLALDRASVRHEDENGYMHVAASHISQGA